MAQAARTRERFALDLLAQILEVLLDCLQNVTLGYLQNLLLLLNRLLELELAERDMVADEAVHIQERFGSDSRDGLNIGLRVVLIVELRVRNHALTAQRLVACGHLADCGYLLIQMLRARHVLTSAN